MEEHRNANSDSTPTPSSLHHHGPHHGHHSSNGEHNKHASPSSSAATPPGTPASSSTSEHPFHQLDRAAHLAAAVAANGGLHHHVGEHEARVEALQVKDDFTAFDFSSFTRAIRLLEHESPLNALVFFQALNFMAAGGGLQPFPHPGLPLPPHGVSSSHHSAAVAAAAAAAAAAHGGSSASLAASSSNHHHNGGSGSGHGGRPSSTPSTPSNAYAGKYWTNH